MTAVTEGRLIFNFDERWSVVKFDAEAGFASRIDIPSTKKVDIVAACQTILLLIEIKDFRGHEANNTHRFARRGDAPLPVELAQKVRDTVSMLLAAQRSQDRDLKRAYDHLFDRAVKPVEVVLFLERDKVRNRKNTGYVSTQNIKGWMTSRLRPYKFSCTVQHLEAAAERRHEGWTVANVSRVDAR